MYDRILVPTDGGDAAETVFAHAADIAARRDATVHVLYVVDDRAFLTLDEGMQDEAVDQLRAEGRRALSEAKQAFESEGVVAETELRRGDPGDEILDYAEESDADLVVMGTRRGEFENSMLGSVSREVVSAADVPVLTVSLTDEE
ncbi:universal stress protein [Halobacterium hubeiense]|uniref:universal stress protein n=1 Tax=Halobacterium hubeiense TaxID=1407499 RepID=UPI003C7469F1